MKRRTSCVYGSSAFAQSQELGSMQAAIDAGRNTEGLPVMWDSCRIVWYARFIRATKLQAYRTLFSLAA